MWWPAGSEWAATVPTSYKLRGGKGKYLLLKALGGRLPPSLLTREKMGFALPLAQWLNGPLRDLVRDHLQGAAFLNRGIVSPQFVRKLLEEHASGRRDNRDWIWSLLVLAMWLEDVRIEQCATTPR